MPDGPRAIRGRASARRRAPRLRRRSARSRDAVRRARRTARALRRRDERERHRRRHARHRLRRRQRSLRARGWCGCCATTDTTTSRSSPAVCRPGPPPGMPLDDRRPALSARSVHAARAARAARLARRRPRRRRRSQRRAIPRNATRRHLRAARPRHPQQRPPLGERLARRRARRTHRRAARSSKQLVADAGLDKTKRTIVSCGSGVGARVRTSRCCEAGFTDVAVYDGSWMEWEHDQLPTVPKRS